MGPSRDRESCSPVVVCLYGNIAIAMETLPTNNTHRAGGVAQAVQRLPSKPQSLPRPKKDCLNNIYIRVKKERKKSYAS